MKITVEKRELIGITLVFKDYPEVEKNSKGIVKDVELDIFDPFGDMDPTLMVLMEDKSVLPISLDGILVTGSVEADNQKDQALLENWMNRYFVMIDRAKDLKEKSDKKSNKYKYCRKKKAEVTYLNDVVDILNNNGLNIKKCAIDTYNAMIPIGSILDCEKAHRILIKNDIQHFVFINKSIVEKEPNLFQYIFFPKNRKPYKPDRANKYFDWFIISELGSFVMEMFDKAYINSINVITKQQLKDLNESICFVNNLKDDDTEYPLDMITLIDHFYTAGSSTDCYFTSEDIVKETITYGEFIELCICGAPFEDAFETALNLAKNNFDFAKAQDDFDRRWEEKFGPVEESDVMSVEEFNKELEEMSKFK